jgi:biotin operon repressor
MSLNTKGIPAELAAELANLANRIELAVRADERQKVASNIATGAATGMHGEPLEPVKQSRKLCRKEQELIVMLKRGFQAAPTLAGNLGVSKQYVYAMIHNLKRYGMDIEIRNMTNTAARYQKIYRLAKTG